MDYANKVVVITGASSGIGEESVIEFAKRKSKVVLVSRNKQNLEVVAEKIKKYNSEFLVYPCDISKKDEVEKMGRDVLEKFGRIDVLVNNAGFGIYSPIHESKIEEIESQMATNYFGMIYCIKIFLPKMLEQKSGHIVNVASVAASFGIPGIAPYCASKFAMLGFSEGLYHELKGTGVGITVVSPIMVKTNFLKHQSFKSFPKYSSMSLSSSAVAKAIVRASSSPRLEIIIPSVVRIAVWFKQTFPYLINPIIGTAFRKSMKARKVS
ncbi:MAG TPA: SDR family NAD(P)-dependent oxidoreductase [Nitrosopumilaceae archaeon]|nr:SDR family NAD(P)-dependent oxidoreductase [Nitrosopumilaceae archaeon]